MPKRFGIIEATGSGTIIGTVGPSLKPDFLETLLACGMPGGTNKASVLVKSEAIVRRCGPEYEGFELLYFGIPEAESELRTGVPVIREITANDVEIDMVVWARAVSWRNRWAYFLNFYDARAKYWRMVIARIEMDKAALREQIGHKLVEGMKLTFMQFEGFTEAATTRVDDISKENFRPYCFNLIEAFAGKYSKLNITNLAAFLRLNRDTVSKYMDRDPSLMEDLRVAFVLHKNKRL
jgi:hypothetical protein